MDSKITIEYTCRFNELYDSDKVAMIKLINTMASFKGIIDFKDDIETMKEKLINEWKEKRDERISKAIRVTESDSEEEEEEEDEDWMDVYYEGPIQDFTKSKTFDEFSRNNTFYMTMGGGPTGGVLVDEDGKVWEVSVKGWGAEWTCEPTDYDGVEVREEDRKNGISKAIRVVNNDEWNTLMFVK